MDFNQVRNKIIELRDLPKDFFNPSIHHITDISKLKNLDKAVNVIEKHIKENNTIVVYADVDIDGVTSTLVAYKWLKSIGANVSYVHHPKKQGHGIIVPNILQCDLLIVVDSTSSDTLRAKEALDIGIVKDVVIIDHHEIEGDIVQDERITLVNPFQDGCEYENKDISGCLLTWRVFDYLEKEKHATEHIIDSLLYLAAISIVSDSMNVSIMENRYYYYAGNLFDTPAFQAIDSWASTYSSNELAMGVNPKLNAAIRDNEMQLVFDFLLAEDIVKAKALFKQLNTIYNDNKDAVVKAIDDMDTVFKSDRLIVIQTDFKHRGYLASRLTGFENKSVIALSKTPIEYGGKTRFSGSYRALQNENLKDIINTIDFVRCIGHKPAGGISLETKDMGKFKKELKKLDIPAPKYDYDFTIDIDDINDNDTANKSYCNFLTGKGFEKVSHYIDGVIIKNIGATGSGNKYFNDINGMRYSQYNNKWLNKYSIGDTVNVIGTITNETYGNTEMTVMMIDFIEYSDDDWE